MPKNGSKPASQPRHPSTGRYIPRAGSTRVIREAKAFEAVQRAQEAHRKQPTRIHPQSGAAMR